MALKKCDFCGKLFNDMGTGLCVQCMQEVDAAFVKVRKYIYQYPDNSDFSAIIENTGIPEKELNYLINRGRIQTQDRTGRIERCIICGAETSGASLCPQCKKDLSPEKGAAQKTDQKTRGQKIQPLLYNQRKQ